MHFHKSFSNTFKIFIAIVFITNWNTNWISYKIYGTDKKSKLTLLRLMVSKEGSEYKTAIVCGKIFERCWKHITISSHKSSIRSNKVISNLIVLLVFILQLCLNFFCTISSYFFFWYNNIYLIYRENLKLPISK